MLLRYKKSAGVRPWIIKQTIVRDTVTENSLLSFLIIAPQTTKARVDGVHRKGVTEIK
jgi:hypothetical protein